MKCRWLSDDFSEVCVNGECPARGDFCPCVRYPEICRYSEEGDGGTTSSVWPTASHLPLKGKAQRAGADDG